MLPLPTLRSPMRNWDDANVCFGTFLWEFCFCFLCGWSKHLHNYAGPKEFCHGFMPVLSGQARPHKCLNVEPGGCAWSSASPGCTGGVWLSSLSQGNRGGPLRLRLCSGHPVLGHQGPAAIPDHHSRCKVEEQGPVGDLQRPGAVDVTVVPRSQPARALLLPVDPDAHLSVHLEETPLRRSSDNHHALLVRPSLLLLPGKHLNVKKNLSN